MRHVFLPSFHIVVVPWESIEKKVTARRVERHFFFHSLYLYQKYKKVITSLLFIVRILYDFAPAMKLWSRNLLKVVE